MTMLMVKRMTQCFTVDQLVDSSTLQLDSWPRKFLCWAQQSVYKKQYL